MATVVGLMEQARALIPDFGLRRRPPEPLRKFFTSSRSRDIAAVVDEVLVPHVVSAKRSIGPMETRTVDVAALARLALHTDSQPLVSELDGLLARGMTIDAMFVTVLAPTARYLGELWEDDACDFVDVTMGLWRLQEVVRDFSARATPAHRSGNWRALFAPMPGEDHNFGTVMVEDVFRRDGWDTELMLATNRGALIDAVAASSFDLVGLTVSTDAHSAALPAMVAGLRSVSRNPKLCIMLGGRVPVADPEIVLRVGADCTAPDARQAVVVAARLVAANACREVFTA